VLISALVKDPEADLTTILPKKGPAAPVPSTSSTTWVPELVKATVPAGKSSKTTAAVPVSTAKPIPLSAAQINSKQVTAQLQRLGWIVEGSKLDQPSDMLAAQIQTSLATTLNASLRSAVATKTTNAAFSMANSRSSATAPRHAAAAEKRAAAALAAAAAASNTKTTMSYTTAIMTAGRQTKIVTTTTQTFAAKLTESSTAAMGATTTITQSQAKQPRSASSVSSAPQIAPASPSKHNTAPPVSRASTSGIPSLIETAPIAKPLMAEAVPNGQASQVPHSQQGRKTPQEQSQPIQPPQQQPIGRPSGQSETPLQQYSLFNDSKPVWECENDAASQKGMNFASVAAAGAASTTGQAIAPPKFLDNLPPQVDASKAPGYRGSSMSSPVLSKASMSGLQGPGNFQGAPSNFTEPPPPLQNPIGMNTSPNQKSNHPIGRPGSHGDIGPPPVSQAENYRHMMNERDLQQRAPGHMHMSSSNIEPPPSQQQYTLAPSTGYEHQHPPPLLKVVQPGSQGHHQDSGQQHAMMGQYPPSQPQTANPNMPPHFPSGANANPASAASMSPPSMHSR